MKKRCEEEKAEGVSSGVGGMRRMGMRLWMRRLKVAEESGDGSQGIQLSNGPFLR